MDSDNEIQGEMEFGDELDLHCFAPADTAHVVRHYLTLSSEKGLTEVRIIHGKGKSVKKREVLKILSDHPAVDHFSDDRFNWGATVVTLKK